MATHGDSLIRKTQKGLSILAFETTKQSRILKKRMRTAALQKEIKADLRDLGNLVYSAIVNGQSGILEEEEVSILVENIRGNKNEVERLRDAIARLSRAKKHFLEEEEKAPEEAAAPEEEPPLEGEPAEAKIPPEEAQAAPAAPAADEKTAEPEAKPEKPKKPAKKKPSEKEPVVPPAPGTDPGHPEAEAAGEETKPSAEKNAKETSEG